MSPKESLVRKSAPHNYRPFDEPINPVALYLKESRDTPFLTREQEMEIGKRLDTGQIAAALLTGYGDQLPPDEQTRLREKVVDREQAVDWMTRANQGLCVTVAKRYLWSGLPFLDLISEGNGGLLVAIDRWEWHRGQPFSTYAMAWIRQRVNRFVKNTMHTIRVPVNLQEGLIRYRQFVDTYEKKNGNLPTDTLIMESLGISEEKLKHYNQTLRLQPISLDEELPSKKGDEDQSLWDVLAVDPAPFPEQQVVHGEECMQLRAALTHFSERDRLVMDLLFGLSDGIPKTLSETAASTGLKPSTIQYIERHCIHFLRMALGKHDVVLSEPEEKNRIDTTERPHPMPFGLKQQLNQELQEAFGHDNHTA